MGSFTFMKKVERTSVATSRTAMGFGVAGPQGQGFRPHGRAGYISPVMGADTRTMLQHTAIYFLSVSILVMVCPSAFVQFVCLLIFCVLSLNQQIRKQAFFYIFFNVCI